MSTRPNHIGVQDIAPKGGYPPIPMTRVMSGRGPSGLVIWLGAIFATFYGLNQVRKLYKINYIDRVFIIEYLDWENEQ
jgi:hypothetical protein